MKNSGKTIGIILFVVMILIVFIGAMVYLKVKPLAISVTNELNEEVTIDERVSKDIPLDQFFSDNYPSFTNDIKINCYNSYFVLDSDTLSCVDLVDEIDCNTNSMKAFRYMCVLLNAEYSCDSDSLICSR